MSSYTGKFDIIIIFVCGKMVKSTVYGLVVESPDKTTHNNHSKKKNPRLLVIYNFREFNWLFINYN